MDCRSLTTPYVPDNAVDHHHELVSSGTGTEALDRTARRAAARAAFEYGSVARRGQAALGGVVVCGIYGAARCTTGVQLGLH